MTGARDRQAALATIRAVLAADCACPAQAFLDEGVVVVEARAVAGRRHFPLPARPLLVVTMGAGVVVSCHRDRLGWARATLGACGRDAVFSPATIAQLAQAVARDQQDLLGPVLTYACSADRFRPAPSPAGVTVTLVERDGIADLYRHPGFGHALSYRTDAERPDMAAAVASDAGTIVGIAAASADAEGLWQIGVDVVASHRGGGIGRAVVSRLTETLLERGVVPYYAALVSNLRSRSLAVGLGYWPAWTDMYAKDRPLPEAQTAP